jgi:hypothetical protein
MKYNSFFFFGWLLSFIDAPPSPLLDLKESNYVKKRK